MSQFVHGLEGLIGADQDTSTVPAPPVPTATASGKQPENPVPVPTSTAVKDSPKADPKPDTSLEGMLKSEHFIGRGMLTFSRAASYQSSGSRQGRYYERPRHLPACGDWACGS